jgi:hypothetical protein
MTVDAVTVSQGMALLPLAWLATGEAWGQRRIASLWWIAVAFGVSWVTDSVAGMLEPADRWAPTLIYPIVQTGLIAAALILQRRIAVLLMLDLGAIALTAIVWRGLHAPDVILHSAASLAVIAIVIDRRELPALLRASLLIYFGLGLVAWLVHVYWLVVATWYAYQAVRLAGLVTFSIACLKPGPRLAVA